jgi:hypothetical protein
MHLPKADHDIPKFGTCTGCGMWGPAFFHCGECGEESGMIFYPQQGNDNSIITQIPGEPPDPEEDPEETLLDIGDVVKPMYAKDENVKWNGSRCYFQSMDIEDLFLKVYAASEYADYVEDRTKLMDIINFKSVPVLLQNIDNLNFNTRLYNEYYLPHIKPSQRGQVYELFTDHEIHLIIKWGI